MYAGLNLLSVQEIQDAEKGIDSKSANGDATKAVSEHKKKLIIEKMRVCCYLCICVVCVCVVVCVRVCM
jgi:hypothetical protein